MIEGSFNSENNRQVMDSATEVRYNRHAIFSRITTIGRTRLAWTAPHQDGYSAVSLDRTDYLGIFPPAQVEELNGPEGSWMRKMYDREPYWTP